MVARKVLNVEPTPKSLLNRQLAWAVKGIGVLLFVLLLGATGLSIAQMRSASNVLLKCSLVVLAFWPTAIVLHFVFFRLQAHLLEMLATLALSTVPIGIYLRAERVHLAVGRSVQDEIATAIGIGAFSSLLTLAGSAWGWSIAKRLNEQRAWRRFGLLMLGWLMMFGIVTIFWWPFFALFVIPVFVIQNSTRAVPGDQDLLK